MAAYSFESGSGYPLGESATDSDAGARSLRVGSFVEALRMLVRSARSEAHHAPAAPAPLQRRHARKPIAVRASCGGDWGVSDCLISDISEGGASVVCGHAPKVGEHVTLEWPAGSEQKRLRIQCSVRHVSGTHTGLAFVGISPDKQHHIADLVRAC